jgi:hypothetical protein
VSSTLSREKIFFKGDDGTKIERYSRAIAVFMDRDFLFIDQLKWLTYSMITTGTLTLSFYVQFISCEYLRNHIFSSSSFDRCILTTLFVSGAYKTTDLLVFHHSALIPGYTLPEFCIRNINNYTQYLAAVEEVTGRDRNERRETERERERERESEEGEAEEDRKKRGEKVLKRDKEKRREKEGKIRMRSSVRERRERRGEKIERSESEREHHLNLSLY